MKDELGRTLPGTHPSSGDFGIPHVVGDLVQVLSADSGIYPPQANGAPDPANGVMLESRIGEGVSPTWAKSGQFSCALTEIPAGAVFIRIFNAPTLEAAGFYTDSQILQAGDVAAGSLFGAVTATDHAIDEGDDDGDHLNNSWEKTYGTDASRADTDMDGTLDGAEVEAGTDPRDATSEFVASRLYLDAGRLMLRWQSVADKSYVVERQAGGPEGTVNYETVTSAITATNGQVQIEVPESPFGAPACYRIRLVIP